MIVFLSNFFLSVSLFLSFSPCQQGCNRSDSFYIQFAKTERENMNSYPLKRCSITHKRKCICLYTLNFPSLPCSLQSQWNKNKTNENYARVFHVSFWFGFLSITDVDCVIPFNFFDRIGSFSSCPCQQVYEECGFWSFIVNWRRLNPWYILIACKSDVCTGEESKSSLSKFCTGSPPPSFKFDPPVNVWLAHVWCKL